MHFELVVNYKAYDNVFEQVLNIIILSLHDFKRYTRFDTVLTNNIHLKFKLSKY